MGRPSQHDLIPSTAQLGTNNPSQNSPAMVELTEMICIPVATTNKRAAPGTQDTPPNQPLQSLLDPSSSNFGTVGTTAASTPSVHKRTRTVDKMKASSSSLHKPFRSPMRKKETGSDPKNSYKTTTSPVATGTKLTTETMSPSFTTQISSGPTLALSSPAGPSLTQPTQHRLVAKGPRRVPFRSPVVSSGSASTAPGHGLGPTATGRLIERQTLESRITQLQSNIRNGQLVLRSQESEDVPLEDLIEKWKKASQLGAQFLLEKYLEQEQVFGGTSSWDDKNDYGNPSSRRRTGFGSGWGYDDDDDESGFGQNRPGGGFADKNLTLEDRWRAEEERLELEDVQYDLPTVEEALRSRCPPEARLTPKPATKMQTLLCSLGIDLATIGYNPDSDSFS